MIWVVSLKESVSQTDTYETFTSETIFGSIRNLESMRPSTHKLKDLSIIALYKRKKGYKDWGELKKKKKSTDRPTVVDKRCLQSS